MATRDEIRAVFADPQLDGMESLYDAIGEMLLTGAESVSYTHLTLPTILLV